MKVHILPRLQKDKWSLYWKTSMATQTQVLDDFDLDVDEKKTTAKQLRREVAKTIGLPAEKTLCRLEGFVEPWELMCARARAATRVVAPSARVLLPDPPPSPRVRRSEATRRFDFFFSAPDPPRASHTPRASRLRPERAQHAQRQRAGRR